MNTKNVFVGSTFLLVVGLLIGVFIGYMIWKPSQKKIGLPKYLPIVVKVPKYITKPVPYKIIIPHHIEYQYQSYNDSMRLVGTIDSLICLISLSKPSDTVWVSPKFLTSFPTSPKLVNMDLNMDSVSITTLSPQTLLTQKQYPLNLYEYKYRFDGYTMSVTKVPKIGYKGNSMKWSGTIMGTIGPTFSSKPEFYNSVGILGEVSYSRIRISIEPKVTINKNPVFYIDTKVGIKLWEWQK